MTPTITGLDHLLLEMPADGEGKARQFYRDFLGLSELQKPEALRPRGGVWFALPGGQQLHLGVVEGHQPAAKAHPCFRCASLSAFAARAAEHGHVLNHDALAGVPRVYLQDPFGNRLEVVEGQHPATLAQ